VLPKPPTSETRCRHERCPDLFHNALNSTAAQTLQFTFGGSLQGRPHYIRVVLFVGQGSVVNAREPAIILKANSVGTEATHAVEEPLLALCFSIRLELTDCQSELGIVCPVAKNAHSSKIEWGEISLIEPAVDQPIWISDDEMQLLAILDRTRR